MTSDPKEDNRFPSIADMEARAARRVPKFAWDYLQSGIGDERCVARNREALDHVDLTPRYLDAPDGSASLKCTVMGQAYPAPFGIAPMGLSGLIWPGALSAFARAAAAHDLPLGVSNSANEALEDIAPLGVEMWFQLYLRNDEILQSDLLARAQDTGCDTLIVTIDIPGPIRRLRDIRNDMIFPIHLTPRHLRQALTKPAWLAAVLRHGVPRFAMFDRYVEGTPTLGNTARKLAQTQGPKVTARRLAQLRAAWPGTLVVKGVQSVEDARQSLDLGADALVVSNHGGRQLDAAPDIPTTLRRLRSDLGPAPCLIADSGVRSGLDIARMIACGADFVLLGRAFCYALAAMGRTGPDHALNVLTAELAEALQQTGCNTLQDLPQRLA
ncbi:alpha-hydroxy acid oxidase [Roseovarius sp. 2305UL8-3]|uniref:alpha-hydroxy acid oxidase n=1 Tax=Roseovarius conchicola TaxID=3121636 RepID=UPI00352786C8